MSNRKRKPHPYEDIISMPRPVSKNRPRMTNLERSAQFSPFAALTGFDLAIKETARLTKEKIELDETSKSILDEKFRILQEQLGNQPEVEIEYFQPDPNKSGGSYLIVEASVKKIDPYRRCVVLQDESRIPIDDIYEIRGDIFKAIDDCID